MWLKEDPLFHDVPWNVETKQFCSPGIRWARGQTLPADSYQEAAKFADSQELLQKNKLVFGGAWRKTYYPPLCCHTILGISYIK